MQLRWSTGAWEFVADEGRHFTVSQRKRSSLNIVRNGFPIHAACKGAPFVPFKGFDVASEQVKLARLRLHSELFDALYLEGILDRRSSGMDRYTWWSRVQGNLELRTVDDDLRLVWCYGPDGRKELDVTDMSVHDGTRAILAVSPPPPRVP